MSEALGDKIVIQVVRSPYNYKRVVYVIIWPGEEYEQALFEFTSDKTVCYQLTGQLALFSEDGAVSINAVEEVEQVIPFSPKLVVNRIVRKTGIPKVGLAVIAVLIFIIILQIIRAANKKNRFESAQKQMEKTNSNSDENFDDEQ